MQRYLGIMLICKVAVVDFPPRPPMTSVVLGDCLGFPWKTFPSTYWKVVLILRDNCSPHCVSWKLFSKEGKHCRTQQPTKLQNNNQPNCRTTTNQIAECGAQFHGTHLGYNSYTSISEIIREESAMPIRARGICGWKECQPSQWSWHFQFGNLILPLSKPNSPAWAGMLAKL